MYIVICFCNARRIDFESNTTDPPPGACLYSGHMTVANSGRGDEIYDHKEDEISVSLLFAIGLLLVLLILIPNICGARKSKEKDE